MYGYTHDQYLSLMQVRRTRLYQCLYTYVFACDVQFVPVCIMNLNVNALLTAIAVVCNKLLR